jgi:hypothetical protein
VHFFNISLLSFRAENNLDQWYLSRLLLIIFQCMSPKRSEYKKLGIDLVSLKDKISHIPKKPSMEEEKKSNRADDSINLLLEPLVHIVKISTFYLGRYGQNWPYCRKIEEFFFFFSILPDNVAIATLMSLLPRFLLSCHVIIALDMFST